MGLAALAEAGIYPNQRGTTMSSHGTTSDFPDWYIVFQQAALAALPRPSELDKDTGLNWAANGEAMKKGFAKILLPPKTATLVQETKEPLKPPSYPKDGEVFSLTITKPFTGLEMVRDDGFKNWLEWRFAREEIVAPQTKRFMLVWIGYQPNFESVERELKKHGRIPQGQWRKAFKKAFPQTDGSWIGVADSAWVRPSGRVNFPCVSDHGESFCWTDSAFDTSWRWLVEAI